jgi:hypothetical protein
VSLDCDRLSPERAARLRRLVERARFFSTAPPTASRAARDARSYTVEIDDGTQCRTLTLAEPIEDGALRELIAEIRDCAQDARGA